MRIQKGSGKIRLQKYSPSVRSRAYLIRMHLRWSLVFWVGLTGGSLWAQEPNASPVPAVDLLLVVGEAGESRFAELFSEAEAHWTNACRVGEKSFLRLGAPPASSNAVEPLQQLSHALAQAASSTNRAAPLWIVLIGHGTFDGRSARFNLPQTDLEAEQLKQWLAPIRCPVVLINHSAASAPFLTRCSASNRVIVTATKSGAEQSYTYFNEHMARAIGNPEADLDHDGAVSVLEAFLKASRDVQDFFAGEGRLASEEALIDDNGDGKGTPAKLFQGTRALLSKGESVPDGFRANQISLIPSQADRDLNPTRREARDQLERELFDLRNQKASLEEDAYYEALESILLKLARLYAENDSHADGAEAAPEVEGRKK